MFIFCQLIIFFSLVMKICIRSLRSFICLLTGGGLPATMRTTAATRISVPASAISSVGGGQAISVGGQAIKIVGGGGGGQTFRNLFVVLLAGVYKFPYFNSWGGGHGKSTGTICTPD